MKKIEAAMQTAVKLPARVAIYVPSTVNVDEDAADAAGVMVDWTCRRLSELFGGATAYQASGCWVSTSGKLITEAVTIVYAFATAEAIEQNAEAIRDAAEKIRDEMAQECVSVEIDGALYLI